MSGRGARGGRPWVDDRATLDGVPCVRRTGIARRMEEPSDRPGDLPGRHRRVVERTMAWLARYRRLTIRYERLAAVHRGLLHLARAPI